MAFFNLICGLDTYCLQSYLFHGQDLITQLMKIFQQVKLALASSKYLILHWNHVWPWLYLKYQARCLYDLWRYSILLVTICSVCDYKKNLVYFNLVHPNLMFNGFQSLLLLCWLVLCQNLGLHFWLFCLSINECCAQQTKQLYTCN